MEYEVNDDGLAAMLTSDQARRWLESVASQIVGRAIIYTGVDRGFLRSTMGYRLEEDRMAGTLTAVMGSGTAPELPSASYALKHWAGVNEGLDEGEDGPRTTRRRGRRSSNPPTRAWTRAFEDFGLAPEYPRGYEA